MRLSDAIRGLGAAMAAATALSVGATPAWAGTANGGIRGAPRSNPIAGVKWAPYEGPADSLWTAYASASGRRRTLLGRLALAPRALFTGHWTPSSRIRDVAAEVVQDTQRGDPNALVQFGTFELSPWEGAWGGEGHWNVADSERWYRELATGIGRARALVIGALLISNGIRHAASQPSNVNGGGLNPSFALNLAANGKY